MIRSLSFFAVMLCLLTACQSTQRHPFACNTGAWQLENGQLLSLMPYSEDSLRWRLEDGRSGLLTEAKGEWQALAGWSDEPDDLVVEFGACPQGLARFAGSAAQRMTFEVQETTFEGAGETLRGRLVLPPGGEPVPILVQVHGSGAESAVQFNFWQQVGPALGVGVFVYDKRGTGASSGKYTQDFHLLAADAAAAVQEARRLAGDRLLRLGLHGSSQGGWISPMAAALTPVDFIVVGYGMMVSPLEENRSETVQDVALAGFGPEAQSAAGELAEAAGVVMASNYREGFTELNRLKKKYRNEPWFEFAGGEFTGDYLRYPSWLVRLLGPFMGSGTTWDHDPLPVLAGIDVPVLWLLAGEDTVAPIEETRRRLLRLRAEGVPLEVVRFPDTEHGIVEFTTGADGKRISSRYAEGYFHVVTDFAKDETLSEKSYGRMEWVGVAATR